MVHLHVVLVGRRPRRENGAETRQIVVQCLCTQCVEIEASFFADINEVRMEENLDMVRDGRFCDVEGLFQARTCDLVAV